MLKAHHPWHMAGNGIEVMRGQEDGHALAIQLMQEVQNIVLGLQVHTGSRLIEQQEVGPGNQGAGEKDPLLLSARELADVPPGVRREPETL